MRNAKVAEVCRKCRAGALYRGLALAMAGILFLGMTPMEVSAAESIGAKADIHIKTAEDLVEFANNCKVADYSAGRKVYLEGDLDLGALSEGKDFCGITSFSGTFYGNHHTIWGLKLSEGSETIGLFRYVEEGALVRDLTVVGNIECSNSKNKVGGIAGINAGTIRNCEFHGNISAVGITGGIVGFNGVGGSVIRCVSAGTINGIHMVGGVVGQNRGVVSDCVNESAVNSGTDWMELEPDSETGISMKNVWGTIQEEVVDGTDFGGIAGWSEGILVGCENKATVGYKHSGKNVGGIVGRQSGEVINCVNSGKVYGKQDVGGIVGQQEPWTVYKDVDELDEKVKELHDRMEQMIDDMESMGDVLHEDFQDLNKGSSAAADTTDALMDEMRDVIKQNVDIINQLADRIDYCINHFSVALNYLNAAFDSVDSILDDLDKLKEDLSIEDQMEEDSYDEAKNRRLVLIAGIGGRLTSDNNSPEEGARVVITIQPDNGYRLAKMTITPYGGDAEDVTGCVEDGKYMIDSMPAANQTIEAVFEYVGGQYLLQSNAGGKATLSTDQTTLRLEPADGYCVDSVTIDGGSNLYSGTGDSLELPDAAAGETQRIQVTFKKLMTAHEIKVVSGTGGTVTADPKTAAAGEEITLSFTAQSGYGLDQVNITDAGGTSIVPSPGINYSFVMPDSDVFVEATFQYTPSADTTVYAVSNVGGSVSLAQHPTTGNTEIVMNCEDGYLVDHITVTDMASPTPNSYLITADEMTKNDSIGVYTYELATSTLTNPVKVDVSFDKKTDAYYSVTAQSGVGGIVTVDKSSVTQGDTLRIAVANEAHYYLYGLWIAGGENLADQVEDAIYEYQVPAALSGDVEVSAEFRPAVLIAQSDTVGGKANYTVTGRDAVFTIQEDTGYHMESFQLLDESGAEIFCRKEYADSCVYKFDVAALQDKNGYLKVVFKRQNNKETVDDAKDNLENQTDHVVDGVNNISSASEQIRDLLTDEYGEARNPEDLSQEELDQLNDLMFELLGYVSDTGVAAGEILGSINTVIKVTGPYADEAMENADQDLSQLSADARVMNDSLQNAGRELQGIVDYLDALDHLKAVGLSDDFDHKCDQLKEQMDTISDLLDRLDGHVNFHSEKLENDMRAVNDKMNEVFNLLIYKLDNIEGMVNGEDIIDDRSVEELEGAEASKVKNCRNDGVVNGDRNAGGIAGCMDMEKEDAGSNARISLGGKYIARTVVTGCTNNGFVTVKTENGGGIAGDLEIGYIAECMGSGRVQSESGNNLGGIAGYSAGTIADCGSLAVLSGCNYIGGIAGQAETICGSYSMVTILKADGWVGAIAGQDLADSREPKDITLIRNTLRERMQENYYVSDELYGVNGVSYVGVAEPVTYRELLAMDHIPREFGHLTVTFIDEEENVIRRSEMKYGADLTELEYPDVVTAGGDYMEWTGVSGTELKGNAVIQAVTTSNVTILSSEARQNAKPLVLAEGVFTEAATVNAEAYEGELPADAPVGSVCHGYRVSLEGTELEESAVTKIRIYNAEGGETTVYRLENGQWEKLDSRTRGSYVEAEMCGTEGIFCVAALEKQNHFWVSLLIAGLVLLVIALLLVVARLKRKQRKPVEEQDINGTAS